MASRDDESFNEAYEQPYRNRKNALLSSKESNTTNNSTETLVRKIVKPRLEKARTVSEPALNEVEILSCHFASPPVALCCRSMSDIEEVSDPSKESPAVPPIKLNKTPSSEIYIGDFTDRSYLDSLGGIRQRFRTPGNYSSRENSCRDRNFFAENSGNNTVIHVSGRTGASTRRRSSFAIQPNSERIREIPSEVDSQCEDSSVMVTKQEPCCHAKGESTEEWWGALEDQLQTTVCSTVEAEKLASSGRSMSSRQALLGLFDDQQAALSSGDADFEVVDVTNIKQILHATEMASQLDQKPGKEFDWSSFQPEVGDTFCYMQRTSTKTSVDKKYAFGKISENSNKKSSEAGTKPSLADTYKTGYRPAQVVNQAGAPQKKTGEQISSGTSLESYYTYTEATTTFNSERPRKFNLETEKQVAPAVENRKSIPPKPAPPRKGGPVRETPPGPTEKKAPNAPPLPPEFVQDHEIVYKPDFELHINAYRFRSSNMISELKRMKEEFVRNVPRPTEAQMVQFLGKQLAVMEKHSEEDESIHSLGIHSKMKPEDLISDIKMTLSDPVQNPENPSPKNKRIINGFTFALICELAFAALVVFSGVQMGIMWNRN